MRRCKGLRSCCGLPPGAAEGRHPAHRRPAQRQRGQHLRPSLALLHRWCDGRRLHGTGGMTVETVHGRSALGLRSQVRLENNGGFIQMALALPALPEAPHWRGLEREVPGSAHRYGVHLRTHDMTAAWPAWRASFNAGPQWRTLRLPFEDVDPVARAAHCSLVRCTASASSPSASASMPRCAWRAWRCTAERVSEMAVARQYGHRSCW